MSPLSATPVVGWVERLRETQVHMSARGDRTAWLGREDSNLRMAESKSS